MAAATASSSAPPRSSDRRSVSSSENRQARSFPSAVRRTRSHVEQNGSKISGYYDRIVHQVSTDGHAYRCSMALEFQIIGDYEMPVCKPGTPPA